MKTQSWFQKDKPMTGSRMQREIAGIARPLLSTLTAPEKPGLASRLRPHELIAMLTHHYARVRARSLPRVKTTISVENPHGRQAVSISLGQA